MKLLQILNESFLPKNKWITIPKSELLSYKDEIFNLISTAYSPIGGHPNFSKPEDVMGKGGDEYEAIDLDDDPEIDAVSVSKERSNNHKLVALGHDNSKEAKSSVVNHKASQLKHSGYFIEVSGKMKDILQGKGVEVIDDEALVNKILKGKDIEWLGNGEYKRKIGDQYHIKTLMGKPKL